ncbi:MAG: RNA-binding domain-containing protein [Thiohalocapsa sp.]
MSRRPLLKTPHAPIRGRLFRDLVLLVLFTVGTLAAASALLIDDLKHDLAEARIGAATALVRDEVRSLLTPVQQQLLIVHDALRGNDLTPTDTRRLNAQMMPPMTHIDQIAAAVFADGDGAEYFLRRDEGAWLTRERPADGADAAVFTLTRWSDADDPLSSQTSPVDHDPRDRPWFELATARLESLGAGDDNGDPAASNDPPVSWSPPYRFHALGVPGTTVSIAWREDGNLLVAAFDVTLARIIEAIQRLDLGGDGRGFLFSADGGVYSGDESDAEPTGFYRAERQQGGTLAFEAVAAWRAAGEPTRDLVNFESGGQRWWGGYLPFQDADSQTWVGVAIPTAQTLGVLESRWHILAASGFAIVALGVGLALLVVRRYSHQLRDLPKLAIDREDPETDIYDLIGRGEGTHLEFKSTMRTNLHTGKPGKEIELSWLKGVAAFLNTEGGILLLGVADDGEVLGLAADAFANDDKCRLHFKNLINQHLGPEYARFLRFDLFQVADRQIAAVECEQADTPTFLRNNQGETFLIRNGPSNIELPISRALGYIRGRF